MDEAFSSLLIALVGWIDQSKQYIVSIPKKEITQDADFVTQLYTKVYNFKGL